MGVVHQLTHLVELADLVWVRLLVLGQFLLGHSEPHGQGDQLSLGAIVQVPLDPPQRGRRSIDRLGPSLFERTHPQRHGIGRQQDSQHPAVEVDDGPHGPRSSKEEDHPGQEDAHLVEKAGLTAAKKLSPKMIRGSP